MNKPPKITFSDPEPLQDFFSPGDGTEYSVARLIDEAKNLEPFDCPLAALTLSGKIWEECDMFHLAWHCRKVNEADLSFPIIIDWRGRVADGRHRIIKALMQGKTTIKAVRIRWRMTPCRTKQE